MAQTPQLKHARRPPRSSPRQLCDNDPHRFSIRKLLDIEAFPDQREQWKVNTFEGGLLFPFLRSFEVSIPSIKVHHHSGGSQTIGMKWPFTGRGDAWHRRPLLCCPRCRVPRRWLDFTVRGLDGYLACRVCLDRGYALQQCSKTQSILIRIDRIEFKLEHEKMREKKRCDLEEKARALRRKLPNLRASPTKRLSHPRFRMPLNWGPRRRKKPRS